MLCASSYCNNLLKKDTRMEKNSTGLPENVAEVGNGL